MPPSFSVLSTPFRVVDLNISPLLRESAATARLLLRTLAIAVCLLLAAPAWGAADEAEAPFSPETPAAGAEAEAKALMAAGHFADALAILRPPVEAGAVPANLLFLYGLAASEASQQPGLADDAREALLDDAIVAFHTMLVAHPGLVRVRLELARAFFRKGEDELARRHFEHVLAGGVPEPVAANVQDIPQRDQGARALELLHVAFRAGARQQYRQPARPSASSTSLSAASICPSVRNAGGADHLGHWRLGMGRRGVSGATGGQVAAARRRATSPGGSMSAPSFDELLPRDRKSRPTLAGGPRDRC